MKILCRKNLPVVGLRFLNGLIMNGMRMTKRAFYNFEFEQVHKCCSYQFTRRCCNFEGPYSESFGGNCDT